MKEIVGYVIFAMVIYGQFISATALFEQHVMFFMQSPFLLRHPHLAKFFSPFVFVAIAPAGFRGFYFACLAMCFSSTITWVEFAVAFIFLPWSWLWFWAIVICSSLAVFLIPRKIDQIVKSGPPISHVTKYYIPSNKDDGDGTA